MALWNRLPYYCSFHSLFDNQNESTEFLICIEYYSNPYFRDSLLDFHAIRFCLPHYDDFPQCFQLLTIVDLNFRYL